MTEHATPSVEDPFAQAMAAADVPGRSLWTDAWHRLLKNRAAVVSGIIMALMVLAVVFGPMVISWDMDFTDWDHTNSPPSFANGHWFGTDAVGRDILVRTLEGGRISLLVGFVSTIVSLVIAPLLGPNIALAFSTSLGDTRLMWSALKTSIAGLGLALILSCVAGMLLHIEPLGSEILARTDVGISGVLLALASGAAAVLSLTTGVSSALVGVMVAVALLPPTATLGMMLGIGQYDYALGAALLLAVNVVCVNLSAKLVFLYRGVKPRTWLEKQKARQSTPVYIFVWGLLLVILLGAMYVRHTQL